MFLKFVICEKNYGMIASLLYDFSVKLMSIGINSVGLFHKKTGLFVQGRKNIFQKIDLKLEGNASPIAWFHCASLGEFEQAKPVMQAFKKEFPEYKLFLTFFSPSGYEVRKNDATADYIFYLPLDTKSNAEKFMKLVSPKIAFFVKYEFWPNYLKTLRKNNITSISFSTIFRKNQVFFKNYGGFYREVLQCLSYIFVQNEVSTKLLDSIQYKNYELTGDTRFDQVKKICANAKKNDIVEKFKGKNQLLVIGSSWLSDMEVLYPLINAENKDLRVVIAPHNIKIGEIKEMQNSIRLKSTRYSEASLDYISESEVLIIDNYGMLSSLYQYADVAYIGGAFNKGLHNTLEAATFGIPIFFGKDETNKKFQEAMDLVAIGAAEEVTTKEDASEKINVLLENELEKNRIGDLSKAYVHEKSGATNRIIEYMKQILRNK